MESFVLNGCLHEMLPNDTLSYQKFVCLIPSRAIIHHAHDTLQILDFDLSAA